MFGESALVKVKECKCLKNGTYKKFVVPIFSCICNKDLPCCDKRSLANDFLAMMSPGALAAFGREFLQ